MAVTPIRRPMSVVPSARAAPAASPMNVPSQQDWVWDGANWVWGPSPPGCWQPQPCPPFPCPPPQFVCNFPPGGTVPPTPPLKGPIIGVTDGSQPAPGQVGEFIESISSISYAAYPTTTTTSISALVVQAGDWDLWVSMQFSTLVGPVSYYLNPQPAGTSNAMVGYLGVVQNTGMTTTEQAAVLIGQTARGLFTVPTLLAFTVTIDQGAVSTLPAGTATLVVDGRRRR